MANEALWIPLFGIVFFFGSVVAIVAITLRHSARKLEHDEILKAIEHGQELPTFEIKRRSSFVWDLRVGVFAIALGAGLYFAGLQLYSRSTMAFALVPLFVGVGFLMMSILTKVMKVNGNGSDGS